MSSQPPLTPLVHAKDHLRGDVRAPLMLLEFGDFGSPACGAVYRTLKALEQAFYPRLAFIFRHFPVTAAHPHAFLAAEVAEAAGRQGRFWAMHDLLFEYPAALDAGAIWTQARGLRLNLDHFRQDVLLHRPAAKIHADLRSGMRSGVMGTPAIFINTVRHTGSCDYDTLAAALGSIQFGAPAQERL